MNTRDSTNYWDRRSRTHDISRRSLLGGAAAVAGVGAAGFALARCGGGSRSSPLPTPGPSENGSPSDARQPQKGGVLRVVSADSTWDTFDLDRSRFTPVAVLLGYTNLGLMHYKSYARAEMEGAFASRWEQPDNMTLNLTLRENLYWHDKPPVNGRLATVDDIVHFIRRNQAGRLLDGSVDEKFYRRAEFASVESVTAVDARTVQVRFSKPSPLFLLTLAAGYAKIQAPEAIAKFEADYENPRAEHVIGTGPFQLTSFTPDGHAELRRFEKAHTSPWLDGIDYVPLFTDPAATQARFEGKTFDTFNARTPGLLEDLKTRYPDQLYERVYHSGNPMAGAHYRGAPPWNDENLYGAIFRAIARRALVQELFQGKGTISGSIPPSQQNFAISEKELITLPGYLPNRDSDIAEAKKMWEAGGGPGLGRVVIDIPDIWEGAFAGVTDFILKMLRGIFGGIWDAKIEPYATITKKLNSRQYGNGNNALWFGWISDVGKLEPSLDLWNVYNSKSGLFPILGAMELPIVDGLTDELVTEFDQSRRIDLCQQVERELLKHHGAGVPYLLNQLSSTLVWNYYHMAESVPFGTSHQCATQCWFDQTDPTWEGRPV